MKQIEDLLSDLSALDIKLWVENDKLRLSAPEGIMTDELRAELRERKTEILIFFKDNPSWSATTFELIQPIVSENNIFSLSFAQQRLWFLDQLEGQSAIYNIPAAWHLAGQLNETALQSALTALIQRHYSLRCCFSMVNAEATVQLNPVYNPLTVTDLTDFSETEQERLVTEWISKHAQTSFDLSTGPLLSMHLLKLSEQQQVLLCNIHHIISDGWSLGILARDWSQLYNAYVHNQEPKLPVLPIQYTDYAAWQKNWLQGEVLEQQLAYWRDKLAGMPELLELPTDYPRPAVMRYQGKHQQSTLNQEITQSLKQLSQQNGVTLYMTLLAAFNVLLYRYSGQNDLVVGSPIANRTHHQVEDLIGFFVNTLVLRTQLQGKQPFNELLKQIRQTTLEAYSHQDVPFEYLVKQLNISRSLSYSPLFQIMFVLQNTPQEKIDLTGLKVSFLKQESSIATFDLTLSISQTNEVLWCYWEYNTDLFSFETIARMTEHFQVLLEGIVNNSKQSLSHLPLLTAAEQQQLQIWNQTEVNYPKDQTIVDLFYKQVNKAPENIALIFEKQEITYFELNTKANQLAHYLKTLGVGVETLVGVCVERSLEMVIGLLGILKAGGAYVPLDPNYPPQRLQFMLEDSQVSVLLTQSHLLEQLPTLTAITVDLESEWENIAVYSEENPVSKIGPDNLAYVIYTSGSTGKPKGVLVTHKGLYNLAQAQIQAFDVRADSRILQFASFSFDASISEIAMAIGSGAQLCLAKQDDLLPGPTLAQLLCQQAITHITLPPTALAVLPVNDLDLPHLIVAGEACSGELVAKWSKNRRFFNAYGPTETTVCATIAECIADTKKPPIGRPIANTQIYILDSYLQRLPVGVFGELYIGGISLARGYLNRPELTSEKFINNPFSQVQNARLYKTGDKARYLSDGQIEYLGRIDNQVKIRGFRIELGEIEAVLGQHPLVLENAVVVHETVATDKRLVAYLVFHNDQVVDYAALRDFLLQKLPDYMIPSAFVPLDTMPLAPSGKINRRYLSTLASFPKNVQNEFIAPKTRTEKVLANIWSEILNYENISINDNFFEQGGHSLLAVSLMAKIEQEFEKNLPLAMLFEYPTIEKLATIIHQETDSQSWSPLVAIQASGNKLPFFGVHPMGGNVFCYTDLSHYLGIEQPFYGLQAKGLTEEHSPLTSIEAMASHYIEALQTIQPQGPYQLGGWSLGGIIAFEMAHQLLGQGHQVVLLALIDSYTPKIISVPENIDEAMLMITFVRDLANMVGKDLPISVDDLPVESDQQFNFILESAKQASILSPEMGEQQIQQLWQVFKANTQAISTYQPQPYLGRITLFTAIDNTVKILANGWDEFAIGDLEIHEMPGDHYNLMIKPQVVALAKQLSSYL